MNYTKNYHLPQWVKSDRIMMDDFNRMCQDMEAGLTQNAQTAASGAAQASSSAAAAQATADSAVKKAEAAQKTASAAYSGSVVPYAVGSYTGTGNGSQTVTLGFRPRFVIISGQYSLGVNPGSLPFVLLAGEGIMTDMISFQSSGFTVTQYRNNNDIAQPALNMSNRLYTYIAFR